MTMGLACDRDGYDLRQSQCKVCGSRGCPKMHACAPAEELEFMETVWEGCQHLDCLDECSHSAQNFRCERFELAFKAWREASSLSRAERAGGAS